MEKQTGTVSVKRSFPEMLKGGVICDVVTADEAKLAEEAGASAVMALERVPADIRAQGGVARMSDPQMIIDIKEAVTIPVMAKCRIGHFVEAEILQAIGADCIDESEVLTPADEQYHVNKHLWVAHTCHATLSANIGRHTLQCHHRRSARLFRDLRLDGVGDIADHAALEHFGETTLY